MNERIVGKIQMIGRSKKINILEMSVIGRLVPAVLTDRSSNCVHLRATGPCVIRRRSGDKLMNRFGHRGKGESYHAGIAPAERSGRRSHVLLRVPIVPAGKRGVSPECRSRLSLGAAFTRQWIQGFKRLR